MTSFHSATLKLTGWYLLILMSVCIAFSVTIYNISARELDQPLPPARTELFEGNEAFHEARVLRSIEGKRHIVSNLFMLNLVTLGLGTGASYLFARRTLRPIETAMEAQARFVSDASHELRTPLAAMRAENEIMLRDKNPPTNELKNILASNLEEVERLQLLTDRLLALSSEQKLPLSSLPVRPMITEAVMHHALAAQHKHIKLETEISEITAIGHSETLSDILAILIDNAIKYSPERTTVTIAAVEHNRRVLITVSDEGDGIPEVDLPHIFDRFYRADQSRSKQHVEGHGLGLALARRLAEINQAQLVAANRKPRGAVFTLDIDKA